MSVAAVTHVTPSHVDVVIGDRTLRVGGDANLGDPRSPYFVFTNTIGSWQPPHEHEPVSPEDRDSALRAIRAHMESKGMAYVVDPTDEQYRSPT